MKRLFKRTSVETRPQRKRSSSVPPPSRGWTRRVADAPLALAQLEARQAHFGITQIIDATGLDRVGIPVVMVARPEARHVTLAFGHGVDIDGARANGILAAVEDWYAEIDLTSDERFFAGAHPLDAQLRGLCACLLRDAVDRWLGLSVRGRAATRLDLTTVDDPTCRALLAAFGVAGIDVLVWNLTSASGVPAFRVEVCERHAGERHALGPIDASACHPDRGEALARALTLVAQRRVERIVARQDPEVTAQIDPAAAETAVARFVILAHAPAGASFTDVPDASRRGLAAQVDLVLRRLQVASARELRCVDLTRRELGVPVLWVDVAAPSVAA